MNHLRILIPALLLLAVLGACSSRREPEPTVESAPTTPAPTTPAPTARPAEAQSEPADTPAPSPTPVETRSDAAEGSGDENAVVDFWTADNQADRIAAYQAVADRYMAANPGVDIRIVPVEESTLSQSLRDAAEAGNLPDIVRLGLERVAPLVAVDLLDEEAASAVIDRVGKEDFRDGPLKMVINPETGLPSAVPYDGWIQAIWYRRDLFEQLGLEAPITWDQINAACDVLPGIGNLQAALTLPTDPEQNYVHQIFEQIAMSSNAWPFDETGSVTMDTPEMIAALQFYSDLQRCAPSGVQNLYDARENYELDQAGMLFYSTYIMDDFVEGSDLRDGSGKLQPAIEDLPQHSSFAASMVGPGGVASYGQLTTLGILHGGEPAAQDVVHYFLTDGYADIIGLAPLGKIPVLESATQRWTELSPIFDHYSPATLGHIASGYDTMQRWLFRPGYTNRERAAIGVIEGRLLIPRVIHNIVVERSMTPESGAAWLQEQVEAIVARPTAF